MTRRAAYTELLVGATDEVRISVADAPMVTVMSLLVDAFGGPSQGVSAQSAEQVRRTVPSSAARALAPLVGRPGVVLPDCIAPMGPSPFAIRDLLGQIADLHPDQLGAAVAAEHGGDVPAAWRIPLRRPREWLGRYVSALQAGWQVLGPVWRQTAAQRDREIERVGVAAVSGGVDVLLSTLGPRTLFSSGVLRLPDPAPYRTELRDRPIALVPMVSGPSASVFNLDGADLAWIGYPVRSPRDRAGTSGALELLIGRARAGILQSVRRPTTMSRIAARLDLLPSSVTYHCGQLVLAGLLSRHRTGRQVVIQRTARGDALVDLLS